MPGGSREEQDHVGGVVGDDVLDLGQPSALLVDAVNLHKVGILERHLV